MYIYIQRETCIYILACIHTHIYIQGETCIYILACIHAYVHAGIHFTPLH